MKKNVYSSEDKDFPVLMNKLGRNAQGLQLSCAQINAHISDFFAAAPIVCIHQKEVYDSKYIRSTCHIFASTETVLKNSGSEFWTDLG